MNVNTTEYKFTHSKSPKGRGFWIFRAGRNGSWTEIEIYGERTYGEAKILAIKEARGLGCDELVVCA
jgi:hypothetical protein